MEDLMNTLVLSAVVAAVFPVAFLAARLCLIMLVRTLPAKAHPAGARDTRLTGAGRVL